MFTFPREKYLHEQRPSMDESKGAALFSKRQHTSVHRTSWLYTHEQILHFVDVAFLFVFPLVLIIAGYQTRNIAVFLVRDNVIRQYDNRG